MPRRTTTLGTPAAPSWSAEWLALVESEEQSFRRRICGAMTQAGVPCTLGADHPSGRCRYHGGVVSVGPPCANQNARVHGLYARRLQRCGDHCPLWKSCPFAGEDVMNLPGPQRPICAYERDEYAALMRFYFKAEDLTTEGTENTEGRTAGIIEDQDLITDRADHTDRDLTTEGTENTEGGISTDPVAPTFPIEPASRRNVTCRRDEVDDEVDCGGDIDPVLGLRFRREAGECPDPFLLHQLVLLTVMQTRAAAVLSAGTLTDAVEVDSPGYKMKSAKPGAALEAFIRIAREWRALRGMIDAKKLMPKPREMGIGSRYRSLALLTRKAVQDSIEDLDAKKDSEEVRELGSEEGKGEGVASSELASSEVVNGEAGIGRRVSPFVAAASEDKGFGEYGARSVGEASSEVAKSDVVNSEVVVGESANGGIGASNAGAVESLGEVVSGEPDVVSGDAASGEMAGPGVGSEPVSQKESARPEAVRPPPLLWSDVLARRSQSKRDGFFLGDRGG